jgi:uncharacterized Zn finger protein (UPF0148 family)
MMNLADVMKRSSYQLFDECWSHHMYVLDNCSALTMRPLPDTEMKAIKTAIHLFYYHLSEAILKIPKTDCTRNILQAEYDAYDSRELFKIEQSETNICVCGTMLSHIDGHMACADCGRIVEEAYDDGPSMESGEEIKSKKSNIDKHWMQIMSQIYGEVSDEISQEVVDGVKSQLQKHNINIMNAVNYSNAMGEALKQIGSVAGVSLKKYIPVRNHFIRRIYGVDIPRLNYTKTYMLRHIFLKLASARFATSPDTKYQARYCYTIARIIYMTMSADATCMHLLRFIDMGNTRTFAKNDEMLDAANREAQVFQRFMNTSVGCYTDIKYYTPFHNY